MSPCFIFSNCSCHHIIWHIYYVTMYYFLKLLVSPHRPVRGLLCPRRASGHEASFSHPPSQSSAKRPTTLVIGGWVSKNNWDTFWWSWVRNSLAQRRLSLCWSAELRLRMLFSLCEVLVVLWGSGRDNVANLHLIIFKKHFTCF